mgnify:CR=1 FL=1
MRDTFSDCHPAVNFLYFALVLAFSMRHRAELAAKAGHKPQGHAQHQRQRRDDAAKEIDELVGGHDRAEAAEPQHHRRQQQRRGDGRDMRGDGEIQRVG